MSEDNAARDQSLYKYPDSDILRNKLGLTDAAALDRAERLLVQRRTRQGAPSGDFDLDHLKAIHRHLFQDVYAWAGEIRKVDIHKTDWFLPHVRIQTGMQDVHRRLSAQSFLVGTSREEFAGAAGVIMGDVNYCHPFREGNGRTQMQYLKQLGARAGHSIDLTRFERDSWIAASIASTRGDYTKMGAAILVGMPERSAD